MANVSFFCTRCRRLTTFPASRRGGIVYCPSCQQALIVPDIPVAGGLGEDGGNGETGNAKGTWVGSEAGEGARFAEEETRRQNGATKENEREAEKWSEEAKWGNDADFAGAAPRHVATVASHLSPDKKRPESWRRVALGGVEETEAKKESDAASLLRDTEVSDAEFLRRIRSAPRTQTLADAPVAPPILSDSDFGSGAEKLLSGDVSKRFLRTVGALTIASAGVVGGLLWNAVRQDGGNVNVVEQRVEAGSIFVEGALTYRTAEGASVPDEGAFVFFFPSEARFGSPIALGNVSPQRPIPMGFADVVAELEKRGARFATTDFEGRFAFDDFEPGEYRVLLVSRRVGDDFGKANPAALKEIEKYVVAPRLLLGERRFFWTKRRFERDATTLEKSFGKAGAPFANVD